MQSLDRATKHAPNLLTQTLHRVLLLTVLGHRVSAALSTQAVTAHSWQCGSQTVGPVQDSVSLAPAAYRHARPPLAASTDCSGSSRGSSSASQHVVSRSVSQSACYYKVRDMLVVAEAPAPLCFGQHRCRLKREKRNR